MAISRVGSAYFTPVALHQDSTRQKGSSDASRPSTLLYNSLLNFLHHPSTPELRKKRRAGVGAERKKQNFTVFFPVYPSYTHREPQPDPPHPPPGAVPPCERPGVTPTIPDSPHAAPARLPPPFPPAPPAATRPGPPQQRGRRAWGGAPRFPAPARRPPHPVRLPVPAEQPPGVPPTSRGRAARRNRSGTNLLLGELRGRLLPQRYRPLRARPPRRLLAAAAPRPRREAGRRRIGCGARRLRTDRAGIGGKERRPGPRCRLADG